MQILGIDPLITPVDPTAGVGSSNVPTHFASVTLDFTAIQIPVYAGFTTGMEQHGIGILGQSGFFEHFKVTFDYKSKIFTVEH